VLRGWGEAFAYGNSTSTLEHLDQQIDVKINRFRSWFARRIDGADWKTRRRSGGVCLLSDIKPKTFDEVPFKLMDGVKFRSSSRTLIVSTDGSVITAGRRRGKDQGPGGWAIHIHESGKQHSGRSPSTTNTRSMSS
jgi:RNA-directed DNA polymerase